MKTYFSESNPSTSFAEEPPSEDLMEVLDNQDSKQQNPDDEEPKTVKEQVEKKKLFLQIASTQ